MIFFQNLLIIQETIQPTTKDVLIYKELQYRKSPPNDFIHDNFRPKSVNVQDSHLPDNILPSQPPCLTKRYAHATSNTPTNNTIPTVPEAQAPDINKTLTSFLNEFKSLKHPILALLTKINLQPNRKKKKCLILTITILSLIT